MILVPYHYHIIWRVIPCEVLCQPLALLLLPEEGCCAGIICRSLRNFFALVMAPDLFCFRWHHSIRSLSDEQSIILCHSIRSLSDEQSIIFSPPQADIGRRVQKWSAPKPWNWPWTGSRWLHLGWNFVKMTPRTSGSFWKPSWAQKPYLKIKKP